MQILEWLFRRKPEPLIDRTAVSRQDIIGVIRLRNLSDWEAARLLGDMADSYRRRFAVTAPAGKALP